MANAKANANASPIRESPGDYAFLTGVYAFLILLTAVILYPLIYIVSSSFSSPTAVSTGQVWLFPVDWSLAGYEAVFRQKSVLTGYANTFLYTAVGTAMNVALTVMIAYPLSKATFAGRHLVMVLLVVTLLFEGGLIPLYLTVRGLGILDTRWAMWLPTALAVWQVIIARTFFQMTIPKELSEAAELDGCSDVRFLLTVVLPLSRPIVAVLVLMYAVSHWNAYFDALIYLKSPGLYPLQIVVREIIILNQVDIRTITDVEDYSNRLYLGNLLKYSLIVVTGAPMLLLYPFVQKYFVQGILVGSLKG